MHIILYRTSFVYIRNHIFTIKMCMTHELDLTHFLNSGLDGYL